MTLNGTLFCVIYKNWLTKLKTHDSQKKKKQKRNVRI